MHGDVIEGEGSRRGEAGGVGWGWISSIGFWLGWGLIISYKYAFKFGPALLPGFCQSSESSSGRIVTFSMIRVCANLVVEW